MKKLGFGCMRLPILNPEDKKSVDMEQFKQMVDEFLAAGFTYFDTAYMYHDHFSEIAVREALVKRHPRDSFTLTSKLPVSMLKSRENQEEVFNEQLEKCGVEYFDYYLLHNMSKMTYPKAVEYDSFAFVQQKKAEGKIKHMGISFHDNAELLEQILSEHPEIEYVQLQLNYLDWDNPTIQSRLCYETCVRHNKPVLVMEPVKGGILVNALPEEAEKLMKSAQPDMSTASWAVRFAAGQENVFMVLSGMSDLSQLRDNMSYMDDFKPLNEEEHKVIEQVVDIFNKAALIPCTACSYCTEGCPMKISIPNFFAAYNAVQQFGDRVKGNQTMYYNTYAEKGGKASQCVGCGQCEGVCPQHLNIIELLKSVAGTFEK